LGNQISKQLLESTKLGVVILYAGSRSGEDISFQPAHAESRVIPVKIDQTKPDDIRALVSRVKKEQGYASIVVANAGVAEVDVTPEIVKRTFDTNYHGAKNVRRLLLVCLD
jgi:NAD(P)-dependent dehydrogenase (short-subunit alcohol dehydrogenase family)